MLNADSEEKSRIDDERKDLIFHTESIIVILDIEIAEKFVKTICRGDCRI